VKYIVISGILMVAIALVATRDASAKEVNAWTMSSGGSTTVPVDTAVDLRNTQNNSCLIDRSGWSRRGQADWDLASCGGKRARFHRKDPSNKGPLLCGETVALQIGDECFRRCVNPQLAGINICSEACGRELHYQWQLRGCAPDQPVDPKVPVVLWNTVQQDSLVYGKRPSKVTNTCWAEKEIAGVCTVLRDR
jgi:hypothetical protein